VEDVDEPAATTDADPAVGRPDARLRALIVLTTAARRGAEIEGHRLTAELGRRGASATVVALSSAPAGVEPLPVDVLGRRIGPGALRRLRRLARDHDVVVALGSRTLPACALALIGARVPWVYRSIGDPSAWAGGRARRARTALLMRRASAVVALWEGAAAWLRGNYGVRRVVVIPNARSSSHFRPASADERERARRERFGDAGPTVAMVGALTGEKRPELGVRIVAEVPGANLLVAGDGPLRPSLEDLAAALLPGRAQFLGSIEDVRSAYAAADVLVLPSSTEGMPGVVIEALMCGVPVVASRVGAVASIHPAIRLVEPDADLDDWVASVADAAAAPLPTPDMAAFDWVEVGDSWHRLLSSVASRTAER
jgi:glycosyltransferase involved in cell wall biosynthesis